MEKQVIGIDYVRHRKEFSSKINVYFFKVKYQEKPKETIDKISFRSRKVLCFPVAAIV